MAQQESRVKKTLLNARVNLIFYFLTLALSFFSRKIFLDTLGADFVGLTGTLFNLLGFLNLAELGIGTAIGYVLYKPLFDKDEQKINEIISVMGYLYRWIGIAILCAGCILSCFLPFIFPSTQFELPLIFFAYFSFLASSLIGYFINYRQNLLGADQRNYVVTAYYQSMTIGKTLIQMALAYYTGSYYLWVVIELTFGIVYSFILNWKINQTYPWLRADIRLGRQLFKKYPEVMKYTRQLFVHKLGVFAQFQTTPFLIYTFVSLKTVAFYGNYTIVTDKLSLLFVNLLGSTDAGVGNLIAENNKGKILSVFEELLVVRFWIAGVFIFGVYHLLEPFIVLWIGDIYILPNRILYLILISCFIKITRGTTDQFLFGYGLFHDTWAPVTEVIIYVVVALLGGYFLGLEGILLGGIVSLAIIVGIWKPYFLYNKGFKLPFWKYWMLWGKNTALLLAALFTIDSLITPHISITPESTWLNWLLYASITTTIYAATYTILLYIFTNGMKKTIHRFFRHK